MTRYLEKHVIFPPLINEIPNSDLGIIVVIPCHNESELLVSLDSLEYATPPNCSVEVITIINDGEKDDEEIKIQNSKTLKAAIEYSNANTCESLKFHTIYKSKLPKKFAGVGLARKIGMDEAVRRFEQIGNSNGTIVCFDADSKCSENYFVEIEKHFHNHPKTPACSIHYEHPIRGDAFSKEIYNAIIDYELHLRYYVYIQKLIGYKYAFQTIGSSMAVRSDAYQKQGGMNKRKAGEDFYFLHKFTHFSDFTELKTTTVIPSPRISERVPFGTGKAVGEICTTDSELDTYNPQSFFDLELFFNQIEILYTKRIDQDAIPKVVIDFLISVNWEKKVDEIRKNSASLTTFINRFYKWFDAFLMMKFVHFARDSYYPNISINRASKILIDILSPKSVLSTNFEFLSFFRLLDKR